MSAWAKELNQPSLVSACGLAAIGASSFIENLIADETRCSLPVIKILNVGVYGLSLFAVQQPGRIDGESQLKAKHEESKKKASEEDDPSIRDYLSGKSLVAPSGWAFAIWGPIFLGELIFVASSTVMVKTTSPVAPLFRKVSGSFIMAHAFQILWTASFRPKYKGNLMYISACMLSGIAYSLSKAHFHFSSSKSPSSRSEYLLYFLPITLHFGWTTAASLVNLNGAVAATTTTKSTTEKKQDSILPTAVGHASAVLATGLGATISIVREAPVFGAVIAWALSACATEMQKRILEKQSSSIPATKGKVIAEKVQKWLCVAGAIMSMTASAYVALNSN
ncbi:hypothetical protein ACA910_018129 [Epithemia clementina (nom. ined.)]